MGRKEGLLVEPRDSIAGAWITWGGCGSLYDDHGCAPEGSSVCVCVCARVSETEKGERGGKCHHCDKYVPQSANEHKSNLIWLGPVQHYTKSNTNLRTHQQVPLKI
jgi:hypothetical protein